MRNLLVLALALAACASGQSGLGGGGGVGGGGGSGGGGGGGGGGDAGAGSNLTAELNFGVVGDTRPSSEGDTGAGYPTSIITGIYTDLETPPSGTNFTKP